MNQDRIRFYSTNLSNQVSEIQTRIVPVVQTSFTLIFFCFQDLQIICSHESWISEVSNVNISNVGPIHPDFTSRRTTYNMDDDDPDVDWNDKGNVTDFFTIDFTLEELRTLRRKQVGAFSIGLYQIVSLQTKLLFSGQF